MDRDYTWYCTSSEADGPMAYVKAILKAIPAGSGKIAVLTNLQRTIYVTNEVMHDQYLPNHVIQN